MATTVLLSRFQEGDEVQASMRPNPLMPILLMVFSCKRVDATV